MLVKRSIFVVYLNSREKEKGERNKRNVTTTKNSVWEDPVYNIVYYYFEGTCILFDNAVISIKHGGRERTSNPAVLTKTCRTQRERSQVKKKKLIDNAKEEEEEITLINLQIKETSIGIWLREPDKLYKHFFFFLSKKSNFFFNHAFPYTQAEEMSSRSCTKEERQGKDWG